MYYLKTIKRDADNWTRHFHTNQPAYCKIPFAYFEKSPQAQFAWERQADAQRALFLLLAICIEVLTEP